MIIHHVDGTNVGKIFIYTLSTCIWCKKTKQALADLGYSYDYVEVDLHDGAEEEALIEQLKKFNPNCSFPTTVINDKHAIVGFQVEKIKKELGL
jgi:glutaredoxin-like protein NrdH